ncbi:hypothetical protein HDU98_003065 [Podochytrium sp. JEL0797]|nr:hypothetical protein HDU98_003065 [Podochytrium sp. JEL0797]
MEVEKVYDRISATNSARPHLCPTPIDLGDGLILRRGEPGDRDELAAFNAKMHFPSAGRGTEDFFSPKENARHPTLDHSCVTVIVDTSKNNKIVSSVYSVPQIWIYGSPDPLVEGKNQVTLIVVRLEAVATDPEVRGKELVKKQFDLHHAWADALGASITFVGGLPQYYARFGYDLSPSRGAGMGGNKGSTIPLLAARKKMHEMMPSLPTLSFRQATAADSDFMTTLLRKNQSRREGLWTDIPASVWPHHMVSKQNGSFNKHDSFVLEAKTGDAVQACGFVQINGYSGFVNVFELDDAVESVSWTAATIELLSWLQEYHFLYRIAKDAAVKAPYPEPIPEISESDVVAVTESVEKIELAPNVSIPVAADSPRHELSPPTPTTLPDDWTFKLSLGSSHPCYLSIPSTTLPINFNTPYYWFSRIPNLTRFLQTITPILNHRLKSSITFTNFSCTIAIMFGIHSAAGAAVITLHHGRIVSICEGEKGLTRTALTDAGAFYLCCNGTSWIRMVLGHRTASEVQENGDLVGDALAIQVCDVMFPRMRNDGVVGLD